MADILVATPALILLLRAVLECLTSNSLLIPSLATMILALMLIPALIITAAAEPAPTR